AIDYDKLITRLGTRVSPLLLERFERLMRHKSDRFLRRGVIVSHRDFDKNPYLYEQGKPICLYTRHGLSSDIMHLGHMVPFV
ncbi:hypothetical protein C8Q76DRAFT_579558, partial [Earliella scabrosa]